MSLAEYIADPEKRAQLAKVLKTSPLWLYQVSIAWRGKRASPDFARRIEQATDGVVTKESLRPDIWPASDAEHRDAA